LLAGITPKDIAYKLKITSHSVSYHRGNLYRKLGVQSIQELFTKFNKTEVLPFESLASAEKPFILIFGDNAPFGWTQRLSPSAFLDPNVNEKDNFTFNCSILGNWTT